MLRNFLCIAQSQIILLFVSFFFSCSTIGKDLDICVSLSPFYALVQGVMEGVGKPDLLVKPGFSPHSYVLKPSEVKRLQKADVIFWGGPFVEPFLVQSLADSLLLSKSVELSQTPNLILLPQRDFHSHWIEHSHSHEHEHEHGNIDPHFWLNPNNAITMTMFITETLVSKDPTNRVRYESNRDKMLIALQALNERLRIQLTPMKNVPILVFHDAYQYFEKPYHLNVVGAITLHPEIPPGAKHLAEIHAMLKSNQVQCLFSEPQFESKIIESIKQGASIHTGILDPLGSDYLLGLQGYINLMEHLSKNIAACISN